MKNTLFSLFFLVFVGCDVANDQVADSSPITLDQLLVERLISSPLQKTVPMPLNGRLPQLEANLVEDR
jgi:hypothetical protein